MSPDTKKNYPPQFSLILRVACGAYLLYLAWGLREAAFQGEGGLLYGIALVVFAVVAIILLFFSVRSLLRGEFSKPGNEQDDEEQKDETNSNDDI
ncbi:MAG: hypothetical protein GX096_01310 [Clostridiales bacterium]|nr:hypothetical protein [Clostridiales bacterium]